MSSFGLTKTQADSPVSIQIEQQKTQRDEAQSFTISKMVGPLERVLRDLYNAAVLTAQAKGTKDVSGIFRKIVMRVPNWTDDEVAREFPENTADVDACIRMAVRAHATVIALTRNKGCKQVIKVPNAQAFFRKILMEVAVDHEPEMFGTKKLSQRNKLRHWIEDCIVHHLISLVPISLFAVEDDEEDTSAAAAATATQAQAQITEEFCPVVNETVKGVEPVVNETLVVKEVQPQTQVQEIPAAKEEAIPADETLSGISQAQAQAQESEVIDEEEVIPNTPESVIKEQTTLVQVEEEQKPISEVFASSPDFGVIIPDSPATFKPKEEEEDQMV